jgi:hypothetical protein
MGEVYLLRHAELDTTGALTPEGIRCAEAVGCLLPEFEVVITGGDPQTEQSAHHLTGGNSSISDSRAGMGQEFRAHEQELWGFELPGRTDLLDYLEAYEGGVLFRPCAGQGAELRRLVTHTLDGLSPKGRGLIVSYGLSIASMAHLRHLPDLPIACCYGYRVADDRSITRFAPE